MSLFVAQPDRPELIEVLARAVNVGRLVSQGEAEALGYKHGCSPRTVYRRLEALRKDPEKALTAVAVARAAVRELEHADAQWPLRHLGDDTTDDAPVETPGTDGPGVVEGESDDESDDEGDKAGGEDRPMTALEAIEMFGPGSLWFDDELTGLAYLHGGNLTRLHQELVDCGYPVPPFSTFWRRWNKLPPLVRAGAKTGQLYRASKTLHIRHNAENSNDAWQLDAFNLDILVSIMHGKKRVAIRPTLLLLIDDHSRFCVGWALISHQTRAEDVLGILGEAFETKVDSATGLTLGGTPQLLIVDNEAAIVSDAVRQALLEIPMAVRPAPAHTPIAKGKVERAGQTVQQMIVTGRSGVRTKSVRRNGDHFYEVEVGDLDTFEDFVGEVAAIIEEYNDSPMQALGGRTRREAYIAAHGVPRTVDDEILARMMVPADRGGKRKMHSDGIHLGYGFFLHQDLAEFIGVEGMKVRHWHHHLDRCAVFDPEGRYVAMAKRADLLEAEERTGIVASRIAAEHAVTRASRWAREYMKMAQVQRELERAALADEADGTGDSLGFERPEADQSDLSADAAKSDADRPDHEATEDEVVEDEEGDLEPAERSPADEAALERSGEEAKPAKGRPDRPRPPKTTIRGARSTSGGQSTSRTNTATSATAGSVADPAALAREQMAKHFKPGDAA